MPFCKILKATRETSFLRDIASLLTLEADPDNESDKCNKINKESSGGFSGSEYWSEIFVQLTCECLQFTSRRENGCFDENAL